MKQITTCIFSSLMLLASALTPSSQALAAPNAEKKTANITFDRPGAIYHKNQPGSASIEVLDPSCTEIRIWMEDLEGVQTGKASVYKRPEGSSFVVQYPFRINELGYYSLVVKPAAGSRLELGCGVIPDVTLTERDWDSPFGVCGHYQRYKKWMIGDVQQRLGIAWVRDEADWQPVVKSGKPDPYLKYLDSKNICWLALFNYVDAFRGVQDDNGIWRWDEDVAMIRKYVEMHKGRLRVYESQNEPNNFGGWSKRWPHPENQQWRPQGWGKPFADLIKQMYTAVKQADPSVQLMWPGEEEWIEYFVHERGAAPYIDLTSIHPYVNKKKYPETEAFAAGLYTAHKQKLAKMDVPTQMWATELGWSAYLTDGPVERYVPVTEVEQAAFLVRSYLLHLYNGAAKVFWYEMNDEPFGEENPESYFGIIRYNSMLTVKPSAVAFANMVHNYRHAAPEGKFRTDDRAVYGFAYRNGGKNQLCVWREKDSAPLTLCLPHTKKITLTDLFGRESIVRVRNGKVELPLGICPLTIRGISEVDFRTLHTAQTTR